MIPVLGRLLEHWPLKLLSIAFAVALWVFVASSDQGEAVYTVPLALSGAPQSLDVTSVGVETVVVRVQARRSVLARLREEDFRAEVSLESAQAGRFVARLLPENVRAPRGVKVVQVSPAQVRVVLEAVAR